MTVDPGSWCWLGACLPVWWQTYGFRRLEAYVSAGLVGNVRVPVTGAYVPAGLVGNVRALRMITSRGQAGLRPRSARPQSLGHGGACHQTRGSRRHCCLLQQSERGEAVLIGRPL
jgi:hypothetical protein